MAKFLDVHTVTVDPNTGEEKLVRVEPYLAIKIEIAPTMLFLKQGRVCDENGRVQEPPTGFWDHVVRHCSDKALREVGFSIEDCKKFANQMGEKPPLARMVEDAIVSEKAKPVPKETPAPAPGDWRAKARAKKAAEAAAKQAEAV